MPYYLDNLKQSKNDTEYDGIEMYRKIISLCQIGPSVDLDEERKGKYLMWLNDYCYTGWGYKGREQIKAVILTETLPTSILQPFTNYKWLVCCMTRGEVTYHELILPTDENDSELINAYTRFFLSHSSLSYIFYENVVLQSKSNLLARKRTYKGHLNKSWVDVMDSYTQLLAMANYAAIMVKRGVCTYGCKQRSVNAEQMILKAQAHVKFLLYVCWTGIMTYKESDHLTAYFMRELDALCKLRDWEGCKALMESMLKNFKFDKAKTFDMPDEVNEEVIASFKDAIFSSDIFADLGL